MSMIRVIAISGFAAWSALAAGIIPGERLRRGQQLFTSHLLTQNFKADNAPITRRSVSETVVENLRVLTLDAPDPKSAARTANGNLGRTVTLEVTPEQAEKINVAAELGKLSLTLRRGPNDVTNSIAASGQRTPVKPTWAGDVSPALGRCHAPKGDRRPSASCRDYPRKPKERNGEDRMIGM